MIDDSQIQASLEMLWRATWQSFVLALIVASILFVASKRIPARWRVVLWAVPLCRLVLLIVPASNISLFQWVEIVKLVAVADVVRAAGSTVEKDNQLATEAPSIDRWFELPGVPQKNHLLSSPASEQLTHQNAGNISDFDGTAEVGIGIDGRLIESALKPFFYVWAIGVAVSLLYYIASMYQLRKLLSIATPLENEELLDHLASRRRELGIWRSIFCCVIDEEVGPASTGLLRPKILITRSLLRELTTSQLHSIVEHELHHIRRFDSGFLLLNKIACSIHWFNPLSYWLASRVRNEMEFAVDASTIRQIGEQAKKNYGDLLLHLATRRSRSFGLAPMADSRSKLTRRIEELIAPVSNSRMRSLICVSAILVLVVTGLSDVAVTQEQSVSKSGETAKEQATREASKTPVTKSETSKNTKEFKLNIVDEAGQIVPSIKIEIRGEPKPLADAIVEGEYVKEGTYGTYIRSSREGRLNIRLPKEKSYSFCIETENYGPYWAEWDRTERPDSFTAVVDPGRIVGGIVVDEKGAPIEGASVRPFISFKKRPGDTSSLGVGTNIKTDKEGRWLYPSLPRSNASLSVEIQHPEFEPKVASLSAETFEIRPGQLASQTIVMDKGLAVTGRVVDASGKPIKGALVRTQLYNDIRSTTSNDDGRYELGGCQEGVVRVVVSAPGMAVDMKTVTVESKMDSVDFTMQPGGHVRIRVVDEAGKAVPKARIFFQRWREGRYSYFEFRHVNQYADENGIWEWNEAPLDEFKADICRPGGMQLGKQSLIARAEEYVFVCPPMLKVVGRVIDAKTRQPIEQFQVVPGVRSSPEHMNWVPHETFDAKNGEFEYTATDDNFSSFFKIQASGYLPTVSRDIKSNEGKINLTFELERGADIELNVLTPQGLPAEGAKVALGIPGAQINVKDGDIDDGSTYAQRTVVNKAGKLFFSAQSTPYQLVITHDSGFAHYRSEKAEQTNVIKLTAWASAKGTFRVAKQPISGVKLYLNSGELHSYGNNVPRIFTSSDTVTNRDGSYRFDRVIPGSGFVARSILKMVNEGAKEVTSSTSIKAEFISNEITEIEFGMSGCPVVGTLVKPTTLADRILWSFADVTAKPSIEMPTMPVPDDIKEDQVKVDAWYENWKETEAGKAWLVARLAADKLRSKDSLYRATCDSQGRFQIDDMPAGNYSLSVRFTEKPNIGLLRNYSFTVPESNASSGEVFQLGSLQLESVKRME